MLYTFIPSTPIELVFPSRGSSHIWVLPVGRHWLAATEVQCERSLLNLRGWTPGAALIVDGHGPGHQQAYGLPYLLLALGVVSRLSQSIHFIRGEEMHRGPMEIPG